MENYSIKELISEEYKNLKKQREDYEKQYNERIYANIPEIEDIDNEISSLAIVCASDVVKGLKSVDEAFEQMENRRDELNALRAKLIENKGIEPFVPLAYKCNLCSDTGVIDGKKCVCYKNKVRKYMIDSSKKISDFSCEIDNDTFENFKIGYYDKTVISKIGISPFDYMKGIFKKCKDYCDNFGSSSDNLFFTGEPGRGKTYMANCIANELLSKGYTVVYHTSYRLFQFLEDYKFGKIDYDEFQYMYRSIYDSDVLIIDDLGTEFITAYTCSVFFDVINSRLLNNKKMIISTNLSMNDMSKNYTERVASRLKGEFSAIHFIGSDIRILKRNEK